MPMECAKCQSRCQTCQLWTRDEPTSPWLFDPCEESLWTCECQRLQSRIISSVMMCGTIQRDCGATTWTWCCGAVWYIRGTVQRMVGSITQW